MATHHQPQHQQHTYTSLLQNINRGILYLNLATQDVRTFAPEIAADIEYHLPKLRSQFDRALRDLADLMDGYEVAPNGGRIIDGATRLTRSSKGLIDRKASESVVTRVQPIGAPFGAIGSERKANIRKLDQSEKDMRKERSILAELVNCSLRDEGLATVPYDKAVARGAPTVSNRPPAQWIDPHEADSFDLGAPTTIYHPPESRESFTKVDTPIENTRDLVRPSAPVHGTSWAKVANLAPSKRAKSNTAHPSPTAFSGHLLPTSTAIPNIPLHPLQKSSSNTSISRTTPEPLLDQQRALYLCNLPPGTTLATISSLITTGGPLISLLLTHDVNDAMPGLSCCVIFQKASDCRTFIRANASPSLKPETSTSTPAEADTPWPPEQGIPLPAHLFTSLATSGEIFIMPAAPYTDPDARAMDLPPYPRRRIKFTKKGLFRDVSIAVFKRDVLNLIGSDASAEKSKENDGRREEQKNVELWHFYNAGECTIVFASVHLAKIVKDAFDVWSGHRAASTATFPLHTEKDVATMKKRYAGVEVSFAHDFNERTDHVLFSTFEWVRQEDEDGFVGVGGGGRTRNMSGGSSSRQSSSSAGSSGKSSWTANGGRKGGSSSSSSTGSSYMTASTSSQGRLYNVSSGHREYRSVGQAIKGLWQGPGPA